jgi:glycosyltransferase involved in cell wall biosynthesis
MASLVEQERVIQTLQRQVAAQNHLLECAHQQKEWITAELARREAAELALRAELEARAQLEQALRAELLGLKGSDSWRLVRLLRRWRIAVAPPGSRRERLFFLTKRVIKVWRRQGLAALAIKVVSKIGAKGLHAWRCMLRATGQSGVGQAFQPDCQVGKPDLHEFCPPASSSDPLESAASSEFPAASTETRGDRVTAIRTLPALDELLALAPRPAGAKAPVVDVIVRADEVDETISCLRNLLVAPAAVAYEVVVRGGAGLDPLLARYLRDLAGAGFITLLDELQEPGERLRRALALHAGRDIVLLETGTAVSGDWIGRLWATAYSMRNGGTASPLTNAATPCGYPFVDVGAAAYPLPDNLAPDALDRLCATVNRGGAVELATGTGPCLYIRRDCLAAVSPPEQMPLIGDRLDIQEFSRRVRAAGWRHLAAVDTFVYQTERGSREDARFRNPDDPLAVAQRMADPALPFRRQIDLARLAGPGPVMLYVTHRRGGGTERHVRDMAARLKQEGVRVIVLRPIGEGSVRLERLGETTLPNLVFTLPGEYWTLRAALQTLGVHHVHVHHTIDLPAVVLDLIADLGLAYDCTIHDYYTVCPRVNLLDDAGVYCGEPGPARCNVCLEKWPHLAGEEVEILKWRAHHRTWLAGARKVFVPHEDVAVRLARYFPEVEFTVRPHFETRSGCRSVAAALVPGEPLRVAVIGHLCLHKGAAILVDCARDALARMLPIHFAVVGYTDRDELLRGLPNVSITGPYREEEILELLESLRCHCAFFASVWPETFSYTLSIAFQAGLFPIAFDLGAPAGRIRAAGTGHLIPLTTNATALNQELLNLAPRLARPPADLAAESGQYRNLLADYYGLGWQTAVAA